MNIPGFNAESSLGPTMGIYRGKAGFGRSGTGEVLPMQNILASSILSQSLNSGFLGPPRIKKIYCCDPAKDRNCKPYTVGAWEICGCLGETGILACADKSHPFGGFPWLP
jgi:hypothetical protein